MRGAAAIYIFPSLTWCRRLCFPTLVRVSHVVLGSILHIVVPIAIITCCPQLPFCAANNGACLNRNQHAQDGNSYGNWRIPECDVGTRPGGRRHGNRYCAAPRESGSLLASEGVPPSRSQRRNLRRKAAKFSMNLQTCLSSRRANPSIGHGCGDDEIS